MRLMLIDPWIRGTPLGGYQGYCYRCGQWGHMARNCGDSTNVVSDTTQHYHRGNTRQVLTTSDRSLIQTAFPSQTAFEKGKDYSVTRLSKSLLTQIKEDNFILGDALSDELNNHVNEVAEQSMLITKAGRPTVSTSYKSYPTARNRQAAPASAQKCTFLLKNNKTGDVKVLTPLQPHTSKTVRFNINGVTKDPKEKSQDVVTDKTTTHELINFIQSDEVPTDIDRDSTETEVDPPFLKNMPNYIIESSNDEDWQLIDLQ